MNSRISTEDTKKKDTIYPDGGQNTYSFSTMDAKTKTLPGLRAQQILQAGYIIGAPPTTLYTVPSNNKGKFPPGFKTLFYYV